MRRVHRHGLAIALALLAVGAGVVWWRIGVITVAPVAPDLYLLTGTGGNVFDEASQATAATRSPP